MKSSVEEEVEAILLDSEDAPEDEAERALRAVVTFAVLEAHLTREELQRMVNELVDEVEEEHGA